MLRVRHQPDHVAGRVAHARDVIGGTVWVVRIGQHPGLVAIAEHDEPVALDPFELFGRGHPLPLAVLDRDLDGFAGNEALRQARLARFDAQPYVLAHEPQRRIADQRARQQACLAQDLEPIADAEDGAALLGERADLLQDGCACGDRAATQVVAVAKPTGQHHRVDVVEVAIGVPQRDTLAAHSGDRAQRVRIVE